MNKDILILGSTGLLGSRLHDFLKLETSYKIMPHSRDKSNQYFADVLNKNDLHRLVFETNPDVIINLVAETNVDLCEQDPDIAYKKNVRVLEELKPFFIEKNPNCHLIHISTDHIYDMDGLNDLDEIQIRNTYALSKLAGELTIKNFVKDYTILRTNFFGKSNCKNRKSFTDWLSEANKNKIKIKIFDDVFFSPISIRTLCSLILYSIKNKILGTINAGSSNGMSKAEFAREFINCLGYDGANMETVSLKNSGVLQAPRPLDMRMNTSSFQESYNRKPPTLLEEILLVASEYKEK